MQKKLLFISHMNPLSSSFGAEQRTNIIFNAMKKAGCEIDIAYIGTSPAGDISGFSGNFYDFSKCASAKSKYSGLRRLALLDMFPKNEKLAKEISELIETGNYDTIFCRYLPYAALCGLLKYSGRLLLDIDDMPEQALQIDFSKKRGLKKLYFSLFRKAYRRDTGAWIRRCRKCYVPNRAQAEEYGIGYLPNISSIWADSNAAAPDNLLFIGKLDWKPNYDGIIHFLDNCWSKIREKNKGITLYVGGKGLSEEKSRMLEEKYPGVKFLGFVKDLNEFYKLGSIVICPIYSGAGTNIKIVEALSMGKTLVAAKESIKGYEHFLRDNENCMIADDDRDFADDVLKAVSDPTFAHRLAAKGYEDVGQKYSIDYIESILANDL